MNTQVIVHGFNNPSESKGLIIHANRQEALLKEIISRNTGANEKSDNSSDEVYDQKWQYAINWIQHFLLEDFGQGDTQKVAQMCETNSFVVHTASEIARGEYEMVKNDLTKLGAQKALEVSVDYLVGRLVGAHKPLIDKHGDTIVSGEPNLQFDDQELPLLKKLVKFLIRNYPSFLRGGAPVFGFEEMDNSDEELTESKTEEESKTNPEVAPKEKLNEEADGKTKEDSKEESREEPKEELKSKSKEKPKAKTKPKKKKKRSHQGHTGTRSLLPAELQGKFSAAHGRFFLKRIFANKNIFGQDASLEDMQYVSKRLRKLRTSNKLRQEITPQIVEEFREEFRDVYDSFKAARINAKAGSVADLLSDGFITYVKSWLSNVDRNVEGARKLKLETQASELFVSKEFSWTAIFFMAFVIGVIAFLVSFIL